ncbi:MAG: response regulator [Magnetococcus sp. DMHC-6]
MRSSGHFNDLSIRHKLIWILMLTSGITLLMSALAFSLNQWYKERGAIVESVTIQARLIAENSRAALVFQDVETAQEILSALKASTLVVSGSLYNAKGELFANFVRQGYSAPHSTFQNINYKENILFASDYLLVREPIFINKEQVGSVVIHFDLFSYFSAFLKTVLLGFVLILAASLLIAFILSLRFQNLIFLPIERLRIATRSVGEGRFDIKIPIHSNDEIGQLAQAFNAMTDGLRYIENILDSLADILLVLSIHGHIQKVNRPELFGYSEKELLGRKIQDFLQFAENSAFANDWLTVLLSEEFIVNEEALLIIPHRHIPVLISGSLMRDVDRQVSGMILLVKDISAYREAQHSLQEKETQLIASQLANQTKSAFLANMSHEIRTPMNAIIGLTDLALQLTDSSPKMRDYLEKITSSSRSLLRIINDILDFSKIEAGKLELELIEFRLDQLLDNLVEMFRKKILEKKIELIIHLSVQTPLVLIGESLRLEQILMNLLSNAIKFTQVGEIEISVTVDTKKEDQVMLAFVVRDTGIGMTGEQMEQLFQPFVQADGSTTRKYGGTGLGLTISKRLVELLNGRIWVNSQPNQGSTFYVTLPFKWVAHHPKDFAFLPNIKKSRVLVVNRHLLSRQGVMAALESFGFEVIGVSSAQEALEVIEQSPIGVVLLDENLTLPKMSQKIPIIHLKTELVQTLELGSDLILPKPINRAELLKLVCHSLGIKLKKEIKKGQEAFNTDQIKAQLAGTHLLLVEDNAINRQVAREILEGIGLKISQAENGQEAVEMVAAQTFNAILMDIHMPIMDGYTATQEIRTRLGQKEIPIIAMTANAMVGDREKSLASGMNDHITKPIVKKDLYHVLLQWISQQQMDGSPISSLPTDSNASLPTFPGLDLNAASDRLGGNHELLWTLLQEFQRSNADVSQRVREGLESFIPEEIIKAKNLVHSIKGMAGNLSAQELYQAATVLDRAIREKNRSQWPELLDHFEFCLHQVFSSILLWKNPSQEQQRSTEPLPFTELIRLLKELNRLIHDNDSQALKQIKLLRPFLTNTKWQHQGIQLETTLDRLDFQAAKEQITFILQQI